jgi:hypothetical protein
MVRRTAPAPDQCALFADAGLLPRPTRPFTAGAAGSVPLTGWDRSGHEPGGRTASPAGSYPARHFRSRLAATSGVA